jgi:hypothetical protein
MAIYIERESHMGYMGPTWAIWAYRMGLDIHLTDTIYLKRKGTFAEKPLEQISKLGVHVIRYLHRIIGYLFGGND